MLRGRLPYHAQRQNMVSERQSFRLRHKTGQGLPRQARRTLPQISSIQFQNQEVHTRLAARSVRWRTLAPAAAADVAAGACEARTLPTGELGGDSAAAPSVALASSPVPCLAARSVRWCTLAPVAAAAADSGAETLAASPAQLAAAAAGKGPGFLTSVFGK